MRVTAVISTLNQEKFIGEAVSSLIDQVDELILVDDGCVSPIVIEHPRLKLIRHGQPQGVSNSYNEAIDYASGDLILIQGGDDSSLPNRRNLQEEFAEAGRILHSKPVIIDSLGVLLDDSVAGEFFHTPTNSQLLETLFFKGNVICAPSVAFLKKDFIETGGFLPEVQYLQDYSLWLSFCDLGMDFFETERIVKYRKHSTNLSGESSAVLNHVKSRFIAEEQFVLNRFLDFARSDTLDTLANVTRAMNESDLFAGDKKLAIQMAHSNKYVRQSAVQKILGVLAKGPLEFSEDGFNREQFASLISEAYS